MRIQYIEGDLLESPEEVIVHGCNVLGAFASGVAGVVRKKFPLAHRAYQNAFDTGGLVLGSVIWAVDGGKLIGNALTQPTYGRTGQHLSYEALESCLRQIDFAAEGGVPGTPQKDGFKRVAFPLIGSDRGGGDWDRIARIIEGTLETAEPVVYVLAGNRPSAAQLAAG